MKVLLFIGTTFHGSYKNPWVLEFVFSWFLQNPWVLEFVFSWFLQNPWVLEFVFSWFLQNPWVLEFVVSNTTSKNQWVNCISLDFYFCGLSEPRKLEPNDYL